jgi:WD40 repeat protein
VGLFRSLVFLAAASAACRGQHLGPVTGIVVTEKAAYSCSQAGVIVSDPDGSNGRLLVSPSFRVTSIAAGSGVLALGGGVPGESGSVAIFTISTGKLSESVVSKDLVYSLDMAPSGTWITAACADHRVLTLPLPRLSADRIRVKHHHTAPARVVRISPDEQWLASGGLDGTILLSRAPGSEAPKVLQDHSAKVDSLAWAPDGSQFASGARDGRVRVHNVDGRLLRTYQGMGAEDPGITDPSILALLWSGDGPSVLAAGSAAGIVYQLCTTDNRWERQPRRSASPVFSLAATRATPPRVLIGTAGSLESRKMSALFPQADPDDGTVGSPCAP